MDTIIWEASFVPVPRLGRLLMASSKYIPYPVIDLIEKSPAADYGSSLLDGFF